MHAETPRRVRGASTPLPVYHLSMPRVLGAVVHMFGDRIVESQHTSLHSRDGLASSADTFKFVSELKAAQ